MYFYCDEHYELGGECEDCGVMMNENWEIATRKCKFLCRPCGEHHDDKDCEVCDEHSDEEDSDEEDKARPLVEDKSAGGGVEVRGFKDCARSPTPPRPSHSLLAPLPPAPRPRPSQVPLPRAPRRRRPRPL